VSAPAIGDLRHELVLEEQVRAPTPGGGAALSWAAVATVWAAIRPLAGRETVHADRLEGEVRHEIWIRHREGVGPAMRLRSGARVLDITAVLDPDGRGRWLKVLAIERLA
jgi:SPP1 family predicted phage head-tail adaptor